MKRSKLARCIIAPLSVFLLMSLVGCQYLGELLEPSESTISTDTAGASPVETLPAKDDITQLADELNTKLGNSLKFKEDFTPSDRSSPHYRVEFRLNAFRNAVGKSYLQDGAIVDIVSWEIAGEKNIRIYMYCATFDQCVDMIKYASPILDPGISDADIQGAIAYLMDFKEANGRYYGNLGVSLFGDASKGYELMIKND